MVAGVNNDLAFRHRRLVDVRAELAPTIRQGAMPTLRQIAKGLLTALRRGVTSARMISF